MRGAITSRVGFEELVGQHTNTEAEKDREAAWLRSEQARLESVLIDSEKAKTLQGRIRRYTKEWLTFLERSGVPPAKNLAEQAVRFLVVLRKMTFRPSP